MVNPFILEIIKAVVVHLEKEPVLRVSIRRITRWLRQTSRVTSLAALMKGLNLVPFKAWQMSHNESHVCDVAPSPTRARGHVAERRAAAPRSPRHPEGVPMHIRAVMRRCWIRIEMEMQYSVSQAMPSQIAASLFAYH
jgi:hypothetical protein